jgi:hypothetical protein
MSSKKNIFFASSVLTKKEDLMIKMKDMPEDMLLSIGGFLDAYLLMKVTSLSREWKEVADFLLWKRYSHETHMYLNAIRVRTTSSRVFRRFMLQRIRSLHDNQKVSTIITTNITRCTSMTSQGCQCSRKVHGQHEFCWQHLRRQI